MSDPIKGVLQLAILKENFGYRELFAKYHTALEKWYRYFEKLEGLPQSEREAEYERARLEDELLDDFAAHTEFFSMCHRLPVQSIPDPYWIREDGRPLLTTDETMTFLDPEGDISAIAPEKREYVLSKLFDRRAIEVLPLENKIYSGWKRIIHTLRHKSKHLEDLLSNLRESPDDLRKVGATETYCPGLGLDPRERVLLVDTSKGKCQLVAEFKAFLDDEDLDNSRDVKETARHLEVWKMVTHRGMKFKEIATGLGITVDKAEFSFKRAYEITQGFPCPQGELLRLRGVKKSALAVTCETCDKHPDRGGDCTEPCEEIERYANQDVRHNTRELTVGAHPDIIVDDGQSDRKKRSTPLR